MIGISAPGWLMLVSLALLILGGAWRALANIHMQQTNYPLHVIHEYEMPVSEAKELLGIIMHLSPSSLARIERVPKKRLDTLPLAAVALDRLIDIMQPDRLVFSAQGLREGLPVRDVKWDRGLSSWADRLDTLARKTVFSERLTLDGLVALWHPSVN